VSAGKPDGILTGRSLVDLALSSLSSSRPPSSSKKGRECQSYIRELLGTPNKLAEHVSQNRGYLAPGTSTSNPLWIRLRLAPTFSTFLASFHCRVFLSSSLSSFHYSFFSPMHSLSLSLFFSTVLSTAAIIHGVFHVREARMDIVSRALTLVRIFFPFLPPCELNSAVFNARERVENCLY